jgi:hypothetical protein
MKAAYLKMMQEIGDGAAPHNCAPLDTQNLGGEMATAFVESPTGNVVPATLFDFLLYGQGSSMVERASAMLQDTTLSTALMSTMPDDYPMLYSTEERDPKIHATTAAHIARVLKERGQIQACGSMEEEISLRPIHIPVPTRFPRLAPVLSRNTLKVA